MLFCSHLLVIAYCALLCEAFRNFVVHRTSPLTLTTVVAFTFNFTTDFQQLLVLQVQEFLCGGVGLMSAADAREKRVRNSQNSATPIALNAISTLSTQYELLHRFSNDVLFHILSFVGSVDVICIGQCSSAARTLITSPGIVHALLGRNGSASVHCVDFAQSQLAIAFLSRTCRPLLCALIERMARVVEPLDYKAQHHFFDVLQQAQIGTRWPSETATYTLAERWKIPRTLAAAWLDDLHELKTLASQQKLEPNPCVGRPDHAAVTPLSRVSTEECTRVLLDNKAYPLASLRPGRDEFFVLHEQASRCAPNALRVLTSTANR